jgi:hypothetical protein
MIQVEQKIGVFIKNHNHEVDFEKVKILKCKFEIKKKLFIE